MGSDLEKKQILTPEYSKPYISLSEIRLLSLTQFPHSLARLRQFQQRFGWKIPVFYWFFQSNSRSKNCIISWTSVLESCRNSTFLIVFFSILNRRFGEEKCDGVRAPGNFNFRRLILLENMNMKNLRKNWKKKTLNFFLKNKIFLTRN